MKIIWQWRLEDGVLQTLPNEYVYRSILKMLTPERTRLRHPFFSYEKSYN
jgi:hypothetical protein